ncbi:MULTISPECIES: hypothetical protein [Sphingomonas]|jgi:hypothetical protein|uniref:Uncharacterized protein n=1 Tax=Sphingomonas citri TaxID=2862499 RepID=A0ABS7BHV8_9SPHN|nr:MULTISPECIES: hypothetical protein [Sphingomonas]MBB3692554.1 uncharacterized protein (UPF0333 family) [Sphingomonas sp. BK580]MBW6529194.1 hypothetical protein [Sphingomonas citri]TCP37281.1 hypothetical protein EV292_101794 [Sphingomonas sp. BK235]
MSDDRVTQTPHTTVIERRGGGGGVLIGLAVLLAVIVGAYLLLVRNDSEVAKNNAITSAAKSVGDTADKAGAAVDRAAK